MKNQDSSLEILKSALAELSLLPMGVYFDLDKKIHELNSFLNESTNPSDIKKPIREMREILSTCLLTRQNQGSVIESKINEAFHKLLQHLVIPAELQPRLTLIQKKLDKQLKNESLYQIILDLTELIKDSSELEQKNVKQFFQLISEQLHDFDKYLLLFSDAEDKYAKDTRILESDIQYNIELIKKQIGGAKLLEDISGKLPENLEAIVHRIRTYRNIEETREKKHTSQIRKLQAKLVQSENVSSTMQGMMAAQRFHMNHDGLTALANRFSYDEYIREAINRYKREFGDFSLAVVDVDRFKSINDQYGHLGGDAILKWVAHLFRKSVRSVDFVARYGGEEFVFILEKTSEKNAEKAMEKLRRLLETSSFQYKDQLVRVTISIGIASMEENDTPDSLFARADKALYLAKNNGRNQVTVFR